MLTTLILLLVGHAVADWLLQPGWLSRAKRTTRWGLPLHGILHGSAVFVATGHPVLAALETIIHPLVDRAKARGQIGMVTDQIVHLLCKIAWATSMEFLK